MSRQKSAGASAGRQRLQNWWQRIRRRFAALAGVGALAASPAVAGAQGIPQHWIAYAQLSSQQLQERLSDGADERVVRLHDWLAKNDQSTTTIIVQIWIDAKGQVSQSQFASLGNTQADGDLKALLGTTALTEPPPADMPQPLKLGLALMVPAQDPTP